MGWYGKSHVLISIYQIYILFILQRAKDSNESNKLRLQRESDYQIVSQQMDQSESSSLHTFVKQYANERENRVKNFIQYLHSKREQFFDDIAANSKQNALW